MLDPNLSRRDCPRVVGLRCSANPCPGLNRPGVCSHLATLAIWRLMTEDEQVNQLGPPRAAIDPKVRDAVNACPSRGSVLPISLQDDCGCRGKELSECREGRGAIPGRVTLRDCLECKNEPIS